MMSTGCSQGDVGRSFTEFRDLSAWRVSIPKLSEYIWSFTSILLFTMFYILTMNLHLSFVCSDKFSGQQWQALLRVCSRRSTNRHHGSAGRRRRPTLDRAASLFWVLCPRSQINRISWRIWWRPTTAKGKILPVERTWCFTSQKRGKSIKHHKNIFFF